LLSLRIVHGAIIDVGSVRILVEMDVTGLGTELGCAFDLLVHDLLVCRVFFLFVLVDHYFHFLFAPVL